MSANVNMEGGTDKIEVIIDSGCRRTIVKPKAFKGTKVKATEHVGKNFRAANGAHTPNSGETVIEGRDKTGGKLKIVAQAATSPRTWHR